MVPWAEAAPSTQLPEVWRCFLGTRVSRLQDASGQTEDTGLSLLALRVDGQPDSGAGQAWWGC